MSTIQVGTRLVREFGKNNNVKKIITEVLDGKVYTKVLDESGKVVKERVKAFAEKNVGDKFVKTTTKIVKAEKFGADCIEKELIDRVYASLSHDPLGSRNTKYSLIDGEWCKNQVVKKCKETNNKTYTCFGLYDGLRSSKGVYKHGISKGSIDFNSKGLPLPDWAKTINHSVSDPDYANLYDKSLKDMLNYHFEKKPYLKYLPDELGLPTLNNRFAHTPKLSDLDKYI